MPDVIDYTFRAGYWKHGLYAARLLHAEITLGGSDIRRQDVPFVSNRMNASRLDALAMYYLKKPRNFVVRLGASYDDQRAQRREVDDVPGRPPLHLQVLGTGTDMRAHRPATSLAAAVLAAALASIGCSKDIPTQETLTPSSPSGVDANAGTWRMIVLTGPTQIDVPAPRPRPPRRTRRSSPRSSRRRRRSPTRSARRSTTGPAGVSCAGTR